MNDFFSRDGALGADDIKVEEVDVPEWGGKARVRGMSGEERDLFEERQIGSTYKHLRARLAQATVIDSDGALVFKLEDIPALTRKSARALDRIFPVALKLSGLSKEDVAELKKNSSQIPS
jgi:hypothetical protein